MLLWINRATDGVNPVQSTDRCLLGIKPIVDQKSGRSRHLWAKSLEEVAICRPAQSVPPLARLSSHAFFIFLWKIPNFCLDRPFGFSVHRGYIPFLCPWFLPGPPFRVFSPPGRSLLPKPPFQVFNLASFFDIFFYLFLGCDCILLKAEVLSIVLSHVSLPECNCSRGGCCCTLQLLMSSKKVCLLFTLFKRCKKKVLYFEKVFASSIAIKNRRNYASRIN